MVKKLFKYEIGAYLKTSLVINLALLAISIVGRIIQFFENGESVIYNLVFGSSVFFFVSALFAANIMMLVLAIKRFYKNLFTAEGYLSFTLPVTASQHITVKLLTAMLFIVISFVSSIVAVLIMTAGELTPEIFKAIGYIFKKSFSIIGGHLIFYIIEMLVLLLLSLAYSILVYYACICFGQRAKKGRVGKSVLAYFVYYLITQVVYTVLMIIGVGLGVDDILLLFVKAPVASIHVTLVTMIFIMFGLAALMFSISRKTMENKLNLE